MQSRPYSVVWVINFISKCTEILTIVKLLIINVWAFNKHKRLIECLVMLHQISDQVTSRVFSRCQPSGPHLQE